MALYQKVVIVGVGLLGGSIGRALLERGLCREVVGVGRRPRRLDEALAQGVISRAHNDPAAAADGADAVIVCTPVERIVPYLCQAAPRLPSTALLTDVGSTKQRIVEEAQQRLPAGCPFIGSHPLAGSERSGFEHARANLLEGRTVVITPTPQTPAAAIPRAIRLWESLGGVVHQMGPQDHDQAMARVSHLPHLVAAALARSTPADLLRLTAGGWRDSTRIAGGDVPLWTQILLDNRQATLDACEEWLQGIDEFRAALTAADAQRLGQLLAEGKKIRDVVAD